MKSCSHLPRKRCMCWKSTLVHSLAGKHLDCLSWQHVEQLRIKMTSEFKKQLTKTIPPRLMDRVGLLGAGAGLKSKPAALLHLMTSTGVPHPYR